MKVACSKSIEGMENSWRGIDKDKTSIWFQDSSCDDFE